MSRYRSRSCSRATRPCQNSTVLGLDPPAAPERRQRDRIAGVVVGGTEASLDSPLQLLERRSALDHRATAGWPTRRSGNRGGGWPSTPAPPRRTSAPPVPRTCTWRCRAIHGNVAAARGLASQVAALVRVQVGVEDDAVLVDPLHSTVPAAGIPSDVAVATTIALGSGTRAATASASQARNWVSQSGARSDSARPGQRVDLPHGGQVRSAQRPIASAHLPRCSLLSADQLLPARLIIAVL